jgi:hypothetical protein
LLFEVISNIITIVKHRAWAIKKAQQSKGQSESARGGVYLDILFSDSIIEISNLMRTRRFTGQYFFATSKGFLASVKKELERDAKRNKVSKAQLFHSMRSRLATEKESFEITTLDGFQSILMALGLTFEGLLNSQLLFIASIQDTLEKALPPPLEYCPQIQTTCAPNV